MLDFTNKPENYWIWLINCLIFEKAETGNMRILATFGNIIPMIEEVF